MVRAATGHPFGARDGARTIDREGGPLQQPQVLRQHAIIGGR
jgi:hypothetical protein